MPGFPLALFTLALLTLLPTGPLPAQTAVRARIRPDSAVRAAALAPRVMRAVPIRGAPPRIDGLLDDPAWADAPPVTDLVQSTPDPGALATLPTTARVLYDDEAIYVAIRLADPAPDSILAPFPRRDDETTSDWAFVEVDSRFDRHTGFSFGVNPRGVQADGAWTGDSDYDSAWNAVWEAAARIDSAGWTAEYRIPFSQLALGRTATGTPMTWGINIYRYSPHRGESANWSPRLPSVSGVISHFNRLEGLVVPPGHRALELVPYTAVTGARAPVTAGDGSRLTAGMGLDLRYRTGPTSSLALSLHPDFGQVEADPSQVNLTTFETFLPEQRPLFVEGSEVFSFDESLAFTSRGTSFDQESPFYSRRVGRPPSVGCPPGALACRAPNATTVLAALRASGRTADGWSGGLFQAWTGPEEVNFTDGTGSSAKRKVEPLTHFEVGRAVREFDGGRSAVGAMATWTGRLRLGDGLDTLLARNALLVGADGRARLGGDAWELTGFALASRVSGSEQFIRGLRDQPRHGFGRPDRSGGPDTVAARSLTGAVLQGRLAETRGRLHWGLAGRLVTPGFESNDLGFQRNADWLLATFGWNYLVYRPGHTIRRWSIGSTQLGAGWTLGGLRRATVANLTGKVDFANYWGGSLTWDRDFDAADPEILRGGPALRLPGRDRLALNAYTDTRRRWQVTLDLAAEREAGSRSHGITISPAVSAFLTDRFQVTLGPSVQRLVEGWQYAGQGSDSSGGAHYLLGRLRQTTAALTTRGTYAFSPQLTLQLYGELFLSGGRFDRFREVIRPQADDPGQRAPAIAPDRLGRDPMGYLVDGGSGTGYRFADPDFSDRELHLNLLLRWEFRPGSTLFLVWTHRQVSSAVAPFRLGGDLDRLWAAPGEDALQAKVSYWLGR